MGESGNLADLFSPWLREFCRSHKDGFVNQADQMIREVLKLYKAIPEEYGWRVIDEEAFLGKLQSLKDPTPYMINEIYWQDMARQIEAYNVTLIYRCGEIVSDGLLLLNERRFLSAALCARAVLELACYSIYNFNIVGPTVQSVLADAKVTKEPIITSTELEALVVRMLWATRFGEPQEHLSQVNVLTYIQKVAKAPGAAFIVDLYSFLCDVAHPNVMGNARYWAKTITHHPDGSVGLRISRKEDSHIQDLLVENITKAIAWSAACVLGGLSIGREAVQRIINKWPTEKVN